jgi:predicted phosphoribosyltransferase
MIAAIASIRRYNPRKIIVAVPTASKSALDLVAIHADQIVCLNVRDEMLYAVADAYQEWYDLTDEEVLQFVQKADMT